MARVLIAEDEEDTRHLLMVALNGASFDPEFAEDGTSAMHRYMEARTLGHPFDLLVLDISLPNMDGIAVAAAIRQMGDDVPLAFFTATSELTNTKALLLNPVGFWIKPRAVVNIKELIGRVLANKKSRLDDKKLKSDL